MRSIVTVSALVVCASLAQCGGKAAEAKPNLVIIALDTLRPDHLSCYGNPRKTSPNIDAWSADAVRFDFAESSAPWTAPSLLSLMTSLYPSVHGVTRFPDPGSMNERVTTLAEVLKRHGYKTGAFTDGGFAKAQFGLGQGFDVYPSNEGDSVHDHSSNLRAPNRLRPNIDRTLAWLDGVEAEPFFLFFHTYEPHVPYRPPEADIKHFRPSYDEKAEHEKLQAAVRAWIEKREVDAAGARLIMAHKEHCNPLLKPEANALAEKAKEFGVGELDLDRMQFWRDLYDAEIRHTDRELQRLLARLDTPEIRKNTVVVIVSDHGEGFGEHGHVGHGNVLHEEVLRVVLMVRAPDVAPRVVADVVRSIDVMPTALDLLRVPREDLGMQGRSLVPLLRGESLASEPAFSHALSWRENAGRYWTVREGPWRYVWDEKRLVGRLFDLATDPGELEDVAKKHPDISERMLGLLRAQRDRDATVRSQFSGPVGEYTMDSSTMSELKKLGYVDGEEESAASPASSEPALKIPTFGDR